MDGTNASLNYALRGGVAYVSGGGAFSTNNSVSSMLITTRL